MDKPIIFLDIDDVMVTSEEYNEPRKMVWEKYNIAKELNVPYLFSTKCVKVLNNILDETNAEIVLTSDWRLRWNLNEMGKIFNMNGINQLPADFTEFKPIKLNDGVINRVNEITIYIKEHEVTKYVVVDDMMMGQYLPVGHFVLTKEKNGIAGRGVRNRILNALKL